MKQPLNNLIVCAMIVEQICEDFTKYLWVDILYIIICYKCYLLILNT